MKWKYFIVDNEKYLEDLGGEGWELVSVIPQNGRLKFYLKKQKEYCAHFKERITNEQKQKVDEHIKIGETQ